MSKEQRDAFFNGRKDADGKPIDRGVVVIRGVKAGEQIQAMMQKRQDSRAEKRA